MSKPIRAVDIGGNGVRVADVSDGEILSVRGHKVSNLDELMKFVGSELLPNTQGIAYAVTGCIRNQDIIDVGPNTQWMNGIKLGSRTKEVLGLPTLVFNDIEAASLGMLKLIPELTGRPFVGMTISSGVGARFVNERGEIMSSACEVGHIIYDHSINAPPCGCGLRGCMEAFIGGESLKKAVLRTIDVPEGMHPCAFLDAEYIRGRIWAVERYAVFTEVLASLLSTIVSTTGITTFACKGTVARMMLEHTAEHAIGKMKVMSPYWLKNTRITLSPTPNGEENADSFLGAAVLFEEHI